MTKEFREKVQAFQKEVHSFYKELHENADFVNRRFAKDMLYAQTTLLNKTGYQKPKSERVKHVAPSNPFAKKDFKPGEVKEVAPIINKDVNEGAFKKKDVLEQLNEEHKER